MAKRKTSWLKRKITAVRTRATAGQRTLPDFLIIGAQKAGTTALYNYLNQHPQVVPTLKKELMFFDCNFPKGDLWYRSFYPLQEEMKAGQITGEASPSYMLDPNAASRAFEMVPEVKLIALLRNPIDRAYSGYQASIRNGYDDVSFEEAVALEEERLDGEEERILADINYPMRSFRVYSYLHRGLYAEQLKRWLQFYPREQLLVLQSERLFENTPAVFGEVIDFLGLDAFDLQDYKKMHAGQYENEMSAEMRAQLREYFAPHNQELFELLGEEFDWD